MPDIENGYRYRAVKNALRKRRDVTIVNETEWKNFDEGKSREYTVTNISVAPAEGALGQGDVCAFTQGLLDIQPLFTPEATLGMLTTFDTLTENSEFRQTVIHVFPSIAAALKTTR
jgi:hypothetical protein